jgi:guanine deaminase
MRGRVIVVGYVITAGGNAGFDDGFIYEQIAMRPEKREIPMQHLQLNQSLSPFIAWQAQENKIPY